MKFLQATYGVNITIDSVTTCNNGFNNMFIMSNSLPNYNLTINNSYISDTNGDGLWIETDSQYQNRQKCFANANSYMFSQSSIFIVNSKLIYITGHLSIGFEFQGINYPVRIKIESTEISHNVVSQSALYIASYAYQDNVHIVLHNVSVNNNSCSWSQDNSNKNSSVLQPSAVHAEFVSLVLNNVNITNSNATGLLAYRTLILINSNSTSIFHNNTGIDGGGLAMYGESYLVFEETSLLYFTNNSASQRGGAIFVSILLPTSPCFYQYSADDTLHKFTIKAIFTGNNAQIAGSVLFGGDEYCNHFVNPNNYTVDYFNMTFNYSAQTGPSVISSEPTHAYFCDDKQHK